MCGCQRGACHRQSRDPAAGSSGCTHAGRRRGTRACQATWASSIWHSTSRRRLIAVRHNTSVPRHLHRRDANFQVAKMGCEVTPRICDLGCRVTLQGVSGWQTSLFCKGSMNKSTRTACVPLAAHAHLPRPATPLPNLYRPLGVCANYMCLLMQSRRRRTMAM